MTSTTATTGKARIPAAERRVLIIDAARDLFGRQGYNGTTTDQIAAAAGISQPYVVRMFGSKESLFLEAFAMTLSTLMDAWRTTLAALPDDADQSARIGAIGEQFVGLSETRGLHTMLLQGFVSGADPAIGAAAREGFLGVYRFLRDEVGADDAQVQEFLGRGMLFAIMLGIGMPALFDTDADAASLLRAAFGEKCLQVVEDARRA